MAINVFYSIILRHILMAEYHHEVMIVPGGTEKKDKKKEEYFPTATQSTQQADNRTSILYKLL